jgi:hypothetical protein
VAWTPCLHCGVRFPGEAWNLYLTIPRGDEVERYRFVVCEPCCEQLALEWRCRALYRNGDLEWSFAEPTEQPVPKVGPSEPLETPRMRGSGTRGRSNRA